MSLTCVFAYGSNMDRDDYLGWCRRERRPAGTWARIEVATLAGHRLGFDYLSPARGAGAANVIADPAGSVPGLALWVDSVALATLDIKEGHPRVYQRSERPLQLASGGHVQGWVYRVRDEHRRPAHVAPSRYYLGLIVGAARHHRFPEWYLHELERIIAAD